MIFYFIVFTLFILSLYTPYVDIWYNLVLAIQDDKVNRYYHMLICWSFLKLSNTKAWEWSEVY